MIRQGWRSARRGLGLFVMLGLTALGCSDASVDAASADDASVDAASADDASVGGTLVDQAAGSMAAAEEAQPSEMTASILADIAGYRSWPRFKENRWPKKSAGHQGMYVLAHYNPKVGQAMAAGTKPLPEGSIIVKDNFADSGGQDLRSTTVMAKVKGHWYFVRVRPNQAVAVSNGVPQEGFGLLGCVNCHKAAIANDYVFTHKF